MYYVPVGFTDVGKKRRKKRRPSVVVPRQVKPSKVQKVQPVSS